MDRWKRLNVFASLGGLAVCIISALFVKYNPLILCISAFSLGIAWKGFKNIYKNVFLSNPFEFINYIKNAEYVVTNSFHGLVFSLIFNKNFWIIPHKTRGSRMTDLLKELKLENRIVTTVEDFVEKDYSETINYMNVNKKINDMRNSSLSWLKKSVLKK